MKARYKCPMVECDYEVVSTKSPLNLLCPTHNILLEPVKNKPLYNWTEVEEEKKICECGHERRDHYRGRGKCIQCNANMGLRCSHFKHPITDYGKFWAALLEMYKQTRASGMFGAPRIFQSILEIRSVVCKKLNLTKTEFDEFLTKAVSMDAVRLHGAPTGTYAMVKRPFEYQRQLFLYFSIMEV